MSSDADDRFLPPDDPLSRMVAESNERVLPALDVVDWWEHPGEEGRTTATGLVGVPRQLAVTTQRILVLRDGAVDRSIAMGSIGGARVMTSSDFPLEENERGVLVNSGGQDAVVWGCWSMPAQEAERLMNDIFQLSHGLPLGP